MSKNFQKNFRVVFWWYKADLSILKRERAMIIPWMYRNRLINYNCVLARTFLGVKIFHRPGLFAWPFHECPWTFLERLRRLNDRLWLFQDPETFANSRERWTVENAFKIKFTQRSWYVHVSKLKDPPWLTEEKITYNTKDSLKLISVNVASIFEINCVS